MFANPVFITPGSIIMMIIILIMMIIIIDEWWTVTPIYVFLIFLNSPVDHIYNNAVHIYDNGLSISSNPVFLNFFPIYTNSVFFPSPVSGQLQLRRGHLIRGPKVSSHQSLGCIFLLVLPRNIF